MQAAIETLISPVEGGRVLRFANEGPRGVYARRDCVVSALRAVSTACWPEAPLQPVEAWHPRPKVFVWARSEAGGLLLTAQDFIGAVPFDGATARFYLGGPDGSRVETWLGEDYGHRDVEVTVSGRATMDAAVREAMAAAGWPPREAG